MKTKARRNFHYMRLIANHLIKMRPFEGSFEALLQPGEQCDSLARHCERNARNAMQFAQKAYAA